MSTIRRCPSCGRSFLQGRRALVPDVKGVLRRALVCRACWVGAEHVVTVSQPAPCDYDGCTNRASYCVDHASKLVRETRDGALEHVRVRIRSMLIAARAVELPEGCKCIWCKSRSTEHEFTAGRIVALEAALEVIEARGADKEGKHAASH